MVKISGMDSKIAEHFWAGGKDSFNRDPVVVTSPGAFPCRHCLCDAPEGEEMILLSYCPFPSPGPYSEVGPIFLCPDPCPPFEGSKLPEITLNRQEVVLRAYDHKDYQMYEIATRIGPDELLDTAETMLVNSEVAYLHVRSPLSGCFHYRIDR